MIYGQRLLNNFTFEYTLGFERILIYNTKEQWESINKKLETKNVNTMQSLVCEVVQETTFFKQNSGLESDLRCSDI